MQRVEAELGTRLFERGAGRVLLTTAGAQLMPRLEDQVSRWQAICRYVQDGAVDRYGRSAVEASGRLAVRFASYAGHDGLLSRHLVEALPDLDVTTRVHLPPSALAGLAGGDLDAAMVFDLPGQPAPDPVPGTQVATVAVEPS